MKKILTFIPLGIGISAAVIYVLNLVNFRIVNNSLTTLEILSNLKVYLYISIIGFIAYFLIKILEYVKYKNVILVNKDDKNEEGTVVKQEKTIEDETVIASQINDSDDKLKDIIKEAYEPLEFNSNIKEDITDDVTDDNIINLNEKNYILEEKTNFNVINVKNKYCFNCGQKLSSSDKFCTNCGRRQEEKSKSHLFIRKIINFIEIIILLLIIYFSLNMLFDYKEKTDPDFESPFKVSMTK